MHPYMLRQRFVTTLYQTYHLLHHLVPVVAPPPLHHWQNCGSHGRVELVASIQQTLAQRHHQWVVALPRITSLALHLHSRIPLNSPSHSLPSLTTTLTIPTAIHVVAVLASCVEAFPLR